MNLWITEAAFNFEAISNGEDRRTAEELMPHGHLESWPLPVDFNYSVSYDPNEDEAQKKRNRARSNQNKRKNRAPKPGHIWARIRRVELASPEKCRLTR